MEVFLTAYQALTWNSHLKDNETILIHAVRYTLPQCYILMLVWSVFMLNTLNGRGGNEHFVHCGCLFVGYVFLVCPKCLLSESLLSSVVITLPQLHTVPCVVTP